MKQNILRTSLLFGFIFFSILYLEILFKIRVLSFNLDIDFFRISLFSIAYAIFFVAFLKFFSQKVVRIATFVLTVVITFLYFNQEIYHSFVEGFYSISVIGDFTTGLSFFNDYLKAMRFAHISYLLPIAALFLIDRYNVLKYDVEYCELKHPLYFIGAFLLVFFGAIQTIDSSVEIRTEDENPITINNLGNLISYSDMDLYTYMYNAQDALKKFGLLTYTQRDFFNIFSTNPLSKEAYQVLITDYINRQPRHIDNNHTGIFEDKNFIMIMTESLDTFAINETLTPHLYQLKTQETYFENFYAPLYYRSTADSEFLVQTSMFPDKNVTLSMDAYINNTFPNTFPKLFEEAGYSTFSFHNYFDYFYPRGNFHLNTLGYDQYWGSEELGMTTGFEPGRIIVNHQWQSDYDLMQRAIPKFINEDQFFVNILTVSGHFDYDEDHNIANPEYVTAAQSYLDNLEEPVVYSDEILYYLAVHIEVDRAIGYLLDQLEEHNKLDDTVIMIFGDHYAYGIDNDDIWAYDTENKIAGDEMDIHNVPLLVHSDSTFLKGLQSEYLSTVDIMPTVANLFDLNLDYKTVFGKDVFSRVNNVVRFANGSFLSSDYSYNALSERVVIIEDSVGEQYIFDLYKKHLNDYMYNLLILEYDYHNKND